MIEDIKGRVLIVMAPTGSGKGTLIKEALKVFPDLHETVSCTTRNIRVGEIDGKDYNFLSPEEFDAKIKDEEFLEWAYFGTHQYGTLKSEIVPRLMAGEIVITEIDIQGVEQLRSLIPSEHMTIVYIDAGSWEILKERALARAPISAEELQHRYERYLVESASKETADVIIDNKGTDFTEAKKDFCRLIEGLYASQK
jgi:guanylate kinase